MTLSYASGVAGTPLRERLDQPSLQPLRQQRHIRGRQQGAWFGERWHTRLGERQRPRCRATFAPAEMYWTPTTVWSSARRSSTRRPSR